MENLLQETLGELSGKKLSPADVLWIGTKDGKYVVSWDEFAAMADFEYNDSYGINEISGDLVVVGSDWWLSRGEYDGSEWWDFNKKPEKSVDAVSFHADKLKHD